MAISNAVLRDLCDRAERLVSRWDAFERQARKDREPKSPPQFIHGAGNPQDDSRAPLNIHGGPENSRRRDADIMSQPHTTPSVAPSGPTWAGLHLTGHTGKSTAPIRHEYAVQKLERQAPMTEDDPEYPEFYGDMARYDSVYEALNRPLPSPRQYETPTKYRARLGDDLKSHSPKFSKFGSFQSMPPSAYKNFENELLRSVVEEAQHPTMLPKGELVEKIRTDSTGRKFSEFYGDPDAWMSQFKIPPKRLVGIKTQNARGYEPSNLMPGGA